MSQGRYASHSIDQPHPIITGRSARPFAELWARWRQRVAQRQALQDVRDLDDRLLADIGIERHSWPHERTWSFWT
jgi:uncharacterized protein YjiS (DUF1127 family)